MPDLTIITVAICGTARPGRFIEVPSDSGRETYSVGPLFDERGEARCTCAAFRFRGICKHILRAEKSACLWEGPGDTDPDSTCPECGGPITFVRRGV